VGGATRRTWGLRDLLVVSLTDAGHAGVEVASCFRIAPVYVSMLRGRGRQAGSVGPGASPGAAPQAAPPTGQGPPVSEMLQAETAQVEAELGEEELS